MKMRARPFIFSKRKFLLALLDSVVITGTYVVALLILFALDITVSINYVLISIPVIVGAKLLFFALFGLYRIILEHFGFEDLMRLIVLSFASNVILFLTFFFLKMDLISPALFVFMFPLEVGFMMLPRAFRRITFFFMSGLNKQNMRGARTLIVGAGGGGELVLKELYRNRTLNNIPIAFVDDDPNKMGSQMAGINVVGPIDKIDFFIDQYHIDEVIIAIANITLKRLKKLVDVISEKEVKIKRLPLISEIDDQSAVKVMDVKIEDLLDRQEVKLDNERIFDFIKGQTVLVTGGGGSIGSELCRQIIKHNPKKLIIFDIYENNAYDIQMSLMRTLQKQQKKIPIETLIGSVYNEQRITEVFETHQPTMVFHAAAYKHVPLMETSPKEAVRTNIMGTYYTARLAQEHHVSHFVLVSSDKAVRPTNVMGATKRYAELIIETFAQQQTHTKFSAVRFGNVLGSNGSVIPLFKKQLEDGGPLTVTHKEITRYFMTIPEAVGLILQCAVFSKGGEIFILDMGEPVKIKDLAEKMIKLAGLKVGRDMDIVYTGLRPGEKLYEELLVDETNNFLSTANDKIFIEKDATNGDSINMTSLIESFEGMSSAHIRKFLTASIHSYQAPTKATNRS